MRVSFVVFDELDILVDLENIVELADVDLVIQLGNHGDPEGMEFVVGSNDVIDLIEWPRSSDSVSYLELCQAL